MTGTSGRRHNICASVNPAGVSATAMGTAQMGVQRRVRTGEGRRGAGDPRHANQTRRSHSASGVAWLARGTQRSQRRSHRRPLPLLPLCTPCRRPRAAKANALRLGARRITPPRRTAPRGGRRDATRKPARAAQTALALEPPVPRQMRPAATRRNSARRSARDRSDSAPAPLPRSLKRRRVGGAVEASGGGRLARSPRALSRAAAAAAGEGCSRRE